MLPPQLHDQRLDLRWHLMRTRQRLRRPIHQTRQTLGRVPAQPHVHRLTRHPEPARHLSHRRPIVQHLEHGLIALLHDTQLHEHQHDPLDDDADPTTHAREG